MPGGDYRDALRERAGWTPEAGAAARRRRRRASASTAGRPPTRSASARASASRSASRATCRASTRCPTRSSWGDARTSRRRDVHARAGLVRRRRRAAGAPFRPTVRIRHRATPDPGDRSRPLGRSERWAGRRPTRRCGPRRPARRRCCTTATRSSAAAASSGRRRSRRQPTAASPTATGGCSLRREPRAVAHPVGAGRHLPRRAVRARSAAPPAAACRLAASSRRSSARGPATRSWVASASTSLTIGDYHLLGASIVAWVGIGLVVGRGGPRPVARSGAT